MPARAASEELKALLGLTMHPGWSIFMANLQHVREGFREAQLSAQSWDQVVEARARGEQCDLMLRLPDEWKQALEDLDEDER